MSNSEGTLVKKSLLGSYSKARRTVKFYIFSFWEFNFFHLLRRCNCCQSGFRITKQSSSEVQWSYLHLGPFQRVTIPLPVVPVYTISKRVVMSAMIQAIQVGIVTRAIPPCSVKPRGAVIVRDIIILILGGKSLTVVPA